MTPDAANLNRRDRDMANVVKVLESKKMRLGELEWRSRDLGYGSEEGCDTAYRTGEVDSWGKRTFYIVQADGDLRPIYLFPDEYTFTVQS